MDTSIVLFGIVLCLLFEDIWTVRNPGLDCILFFDQLGSHLQKETVARAQQKGVHHWSLPKNTSHFTQPLDDVPFASFKLALARLHSQDVQSASLSGEDLSNRLITASYQAEKEAFSSSIIQRAFRVVGLSPFDKELILGNAEANLGNQIDDDRSEVLNDCIRACKAALDDYSPKPISKRRGTVRKDIIHSPSSLITSAEAHEARAALAQREKEVKQASRKHKVTIYQYILVDIHYN